jgi:hypothetical protein
MYAVLGSLSGCPWSVHWRGSRIRLHRHKSYRGHSGDPVVHCIRCISPGLPPLSLLFGWEISHCDHEVGLDAYRGIFLQESAHGVPKCWPVVCSKCSKPNPRSRGLTDLSWLSKTWLDTFFIVLHKCWLNPKWLKFLVICW